MAMHANNVISLFTRHQPRPSDWAHSEIEQFQRVEASLLQAGLPVEHARGLTDEGEPWYAFYHRDTGDVFVHFARIDGTYIVESPAMPQPIFDSSFLEMINRLGNSHPLLLVDEDKGKVTRLYIHPAAFLISAVAVLFFKSTPSEAAEAEPQAATTRTGDGNAVRATHTGWQFSVAEGHAMALLSVMSILPFMKSPDLLKVLSGNEPIKVAFGEIEGVGTAETSNSPEHNIAQVEHVAFANVSSTGADVGSLALPSTDLAKAVETLIATNIIENQVPELNLAAVDPVDVYWTPAASWSESNVEPAVVKQVSADEPTGDSVSVQQLQSSDALEFLAFMVLEVPEILALPEGVIDPEFSAPLLDVAIIPAPTVVVSTTPTEDTYQSPDLGNALDLLAEFILATPQYDVHYTGGTVYFIEENAEYDPRHSQVIQFADGTSIVLVGAPDPYDVDMAVA